MQATLIEDENGLDISPEKNDKAAQITVKTEKQRRPQSFTVISLFIILFVSFAVAGWLYIGKRALTQTRGELLNENRTVLASLGVMEQKAELFENKIAKLQSRNKTLENQNETLVNQGQTFKAQNEKLTNKVSILADQLDKASRVYRQRLAELQAKIDRLAAENAALLEKNTRPTGQNKTPKSQKPPLKTGEAYSIASGATSKELIALIEPLGEYGKLPLTKKAE